MANNNTTQKARKYQSGDSVWNWTIIGEYGKAKNGTVLWECKCQCGNTRIIETGSLNSGRRKSCGCLRQINRKVKLKKGDTFGYWTVIEKCDNSNSKWMCRCSCGTVKPVDAFAMWYGKSVSCGCINKHSVKTGDVFGYWTAIEEVSGENPRRFLCKCVCGTIKGILISDLIAGSSKSCGCLRGSLISEKRTRHGLTESREYNSWCGMKNRCYNTKSKKYPIYGARGITMCHRWFNSFDEFYEDMGQKPSISHSIDRVDNNGNYDCGKCDDCHSRGVFNCNCRWATAKQQGRNTRSNRYFDYNGKRLMLVELSEISGFSVSLIRLRINSGMTLDEALTTPRSRKITLRHNDQELTISEWSRITGLNGGTILGRVRDGWTIERALTTPVHKNRLHKE